MIGWIILFVVQVMDCKSNDLLPVEKPDLNHAIKLFKEGKYDLSNTELLKLYETSPDSPEVLFYLGECNFFQNNLENAIKYYRHCQDVFVKQSGSGHNLGKYASMQKKVEARLENCSMLIKESGEKEVGDNSPSPVEVDATPPPAQTVSSPEPEPKNEDRNTEPLEVVPVSPSANIESDLLDYNGDQNTFTEKQAGVIYKLYSENPTTLSRYNLKEGEKGWEIPTEKELRAFLNIVIQSNQKVKTPYSDLFISDEDEISFVSSEFISEEGIQKYKCLYIRNNVIKSVLKEDIEQVSILLKQRSN